MGQYNSRPTAIEPRAKNEKNAAILIIVLHNWLLMIISKSKSNLHIPKTSSIRTTLFENISHYFRFYATTYLCWESGKKKYILSFSLSHKRPIEDVCPPKRGCKTTLLMVTYSSAWWSGERPKIIVVLHTSSTQKSQNGREEPSTTKTPVLECTSG